MQQVTQYIGFAPIDANDWGQDTVFAKFDIVVAPEDQAAYAQAYAKMMAEVGEDIELRSYGLGAVGFGRDKFTHWIWTGAQSIEALGALSQKISAHPAYIEFNKEVGNLREVVNVSQIQTLKSIPSTKALGTEKGEPHPSQPDGVGELSLPALVEEDGLCCDFRGQVEGYGNLCFPSLFLRFKGRISRNAWRSQNLPGRWYLYHHPPPRHLCPGGGGAEAILPTPPTRVVNSSPGPLISPRTSLRFAIGS